ncbi:MAG: phosphatidylglycerophosphatase A [Acidobacteria bacterium]|nr:MAG: phosphatidylglycerophosphatase A [Acidobacteriota bacterium]
MTGCRSAIGFRRRSPARKSPKLPWPNRPRKPGATARRIVTEKRRGAAVWIATGAGIGYLPVPGTFGAAAGLGIVAALARWVTYRSWLWALVGVATAAVFVLGVWAAGSAEEFFGHTDPSYVVIDEVAGQMVTFLLRPDAPWRWLLAGFVLFRVFDVLKPFPAGRAEGLPGGWGVMTDDMVAGVYSLAALAVLRFIFK